MALNDESNGGIPATMLVGPTSVGNAAVPYYPYPVYGGQQNGNNSGFGGDWGWIILLLLLANGGWGGMGGMGGGMMWPMMMGAGMGGFGLGYDFPWLLAGQNNINNNTSSGFRDAQLHDSITSVRDGVSNLSTQLCDCCGNVQMSIAGVNQGVSNAAAGINQNISTTGAGIQQSLCNGFAGVNLGMANGFAGVNSAISNTAAQGEIAANGRHSALTNQLYNGEINSLNRSFAEQTANAQGFNGLQGQLAQCCCDNRAGLAELKYTVATENCADRAAVSDGIRDVIANSTGNTNALLNALNGGIQSIKDQLCADKIDAKNDTIAQLRSELLYARGQASQDVQTARILAGQTAETDAIYNRLSQCPVGTTPVYGNQPIFTCPNNGFNNGCGCGCGQ